MKAEYAGMQRLLEQSERHNDTLNKQLNLTVRILDSQDTRISGPRSIKRGSETRNSSFLSEPDLNFFRPSWPEKLDE